MQGITVAEHSDLIILCLGLDETIEGEELDEGNNSGSGDKKDLELPEVQQRLLEKITELGKPVVLCLTAGSAINLSYADEYCNGILQTWYPGASGGKAVADILFGKCSPSGKLPVTFYRSLDNMLEFTDYAMTNRTYRYMKEEALYPFGYGLTYGNVVCTLAKIVEPVVLNEDIKIQVNVENKGDFVTEEVIQCYIKDLESKYAVPNYSLCGFKRIRLEPKEKKTINISIPFNSLKAVNENGEKILDSNQYLIYIGICQPDGRSKKLTGNFPIQLSLKL